MSQQSGVSYINPHGYAVNNLEDAVPTYIGKVNAEGVWLMQRYNSSTGFMDYANLSNNATTVLYTDAWSGRVGLTYGGFQTLTGV